MQKLEISSEKKIRKLGKKNIVELCDKLECLFFLMNDPKLLEKMYDNIEFKAADYKQYKKVIKI